MNDGKIYKSPMQFSSETIDLPKVSGGKPYQVSSNMIFMSSLDYKGTDMMQSDGIVVFNEKSKQFQIVAKSKPYKNKILIGGEVGFCLVQCLQKLAPLRGKGVLRACDEARRGREKRLKLLSLHL